MIPKGGVGIEVGVNKGFMAAALLEIASPRRLYLLDCWKSQRTMYDPGYIYTPEQEEKAYQMVVKMFASQENVEVIRAESPDASSLFPDGLFDWVYIDANHTYLAAQADIDAWWPKVGRGGLLAGHDYVNDGHQYQVKRVVDEFCAREGLSILALSEAKKFKDWAIRKP